MEDLKFFLQPSGSARQTPRSRKTCLYIRQQMLPQQSIEIHSWIAETCRELPFILCKRTSTSSAAFHRTVDFTCFAIPPDGGVSYPFCKIHLNLWTSPWEWSRIWLTHVYTLLDRLIPMRSQVFTPTVNSAIANWVESTMCRLTFDRSE